MDTASVRGRRVAYSSEDFVNRARHPSHQDAATSAKILLHSKTDKPVNLRAIVSQSLSRAEGERKAVVQVARAVGESSPPIKSVTNAWQKVKTSVYGFFGLNNNKSREATLAMTVGRLQSHFGVSVPNFQTAWENRQNNNKEYRLLIKFGRAASQVESVEFLMAVEDLRSAPSVDKASKILQVFIEPETIDDFGIPIADPSKLPINLQSESERKELMNKVGGCIERAKSGDPQAMNEVLAELALVEAYLVKMIKINLDTVYRAEILNVARRMPANSVFSTGPGSLA